MISALFTVALLSAIVFEFTGGFLSSRLGNVKVTRAGFVLMGLFMCSLLSFRQYQLLFVTVILWGTGWALTHVGLSSYLTHFPERILRDASSLNSSLRFLFGGLGAWAGGLIVSYVGFEALFVCVGISIFLLGFLLRRILEQRKECYGTVKG